MKQAKPPERKTNSELVAEAKASGRIAKPVAPKLDQEFFRAKGELLAEELGFNGADTDEIDGVSCADAKNFLTKTLHEVHVAVSFPAEKMPKVENIAAHLMLADDPDSVKALEKALAKAIAEEMAALEKVG